MWHWCSKDYWPHIHLFSYLIHLFIKYIYGLLCTRWCTRCWSFRAEENRYGPYPFGLPIFHIPSITLSLVMDNGNKHTYTRWVHNISDFTWTFTVFIIRKITVFRSVLNSTRSVMHHLVFDHLWWSLKMSFCALMWLMGTGKTVRMELKVSDILMTNITLNTI